LLIALLVESVTLLADVVSHRQPEF
jgi:hypothetical protein